MARIPSYWTRAELDIDRALARDAFVESRIHQDPAGTSQYLHAVAEDSASVRDLLRHTHNLRVVTSASLRDAETMDLIRYVCLPTVSVDDLDTMFSTRIGAWIRSPNTDPGNLDLVAKYVSNHLDPEWTPWVVEDRDPSAAEVDVFARWVASQRVSSRIVMLRRTNDSLSQESSIREALLLAGYEGVEKQAGLRGEAFLPARDLPERSFTAKPRVLEGKSADIVIRLGDNHPSGMKVLVVEAKVSATAINSRKRLFEVVAKKDAWNRSEELPQEFRTVAALSGVFGLKELVDLQAAGVFIVWSHRLSDLEEFVA